MKVIRNLHFWVILVIFAVITVVHYLPGVYGTSTASFLGLGRHTLERVLLLLPIAYAGFVFGTWGAAASLLVSAGIMLPRAIMISDSPAEALLESGAAILAGVVLNLCFYLYRLNIIRYSHTDEVLAEIIDKLPIPAFAIDYNHRVTHWNTAIEAITGINKGQIIGTDEQWKVFYDSKTSTMADLILEDSPMDKIKARYNGRAKKSTLIEGAYESENYFSSIGKGGRWLHFTASPIKDRNGRITGVIETLEDVTERVKAEQALRESEANFRSLFESALDAIWVYDLEGNIQAANAAATRLTGYSMEELRGSNIALLLTRESLLRSREIQERLRLKQSTMSYEQNVVRSDESEAACMVTTSPIYRDSELKGFQNIARDVTQQKKLYENLRYYLREITRAQEEERKRISRELHDSTAQNLIALLHKMENLLDERASLPVKQAKALWTFYENLRDILQEVRRFSKDLRPSVLDDLGLLPAIDWLVNENRTEYGIETKLKIEGKERRLVPEAELLLFRVVQEALRNITKHSNAALAEVVVKFNEKSVDLNITDNGQGFRLPDNVGDLPQIGKLGIAGMQERVQLLSGTLNIESEPGKGTRIKVNVPV